LLVKPSIQGLIQSALMKRSVVLTHPVLSHPVLTHIGPMALLADSQLLFGGEKGGPLSQWVMDQMSARYAGDVSSASGISKKAVYIGAANGNAIEFYQMATDVCRQWGVDSVVHVENVKQLVDLSVENIAVMILAGGDVALGWNFLSQPSVRNWLNHYTQTNGLIVGISAGAIHLASTFSKGCGSRVCFLEYCTVNIAAHEEQERWPSVRSWQQSTNDEQLLFIGLPFGGGVLIEPNAVMFEGARAIGKGYEVFEKHTTII